MSSPRDTTLPQRLGAPATISESSWRFLKVSENTMAFRRFRNIRSCHEPIAIASYACRRSRPGSVSGAKLTKNEFPQWCTRHPLGTAQPVDFRIFRIFRKIRIFRKFPIGNQIAIAFNGGRTVSRESSPAGHRGQTGARRSGYAQIDFQKISEFSETF